jgi:3-hydroxyacyl-[acyl-carrier-protein] dehydratase
MISGKYLPRIMPNSAKKNQMKYIPQAPPFVMIDELCSASEAETRTQFTIREGHLFVQDNLFTEPGLIENMAQTAAAGTGYKATLTGQPAPVGFIGAIKNLEINYLPKVGETIISCVKMVHQVMNAHIVEGTITCEGKVIASAEFKIFLQ